MWDTQRRQCRSLTLKTDSGDRPGTAQFLPSAFPPSVAEMRRTGRFLFSPGRVNQGSAPTDRIVRFGGKFAQRPDNQAITSLARFAGQFPIKVNQGSLDFANGPEKQTISDIRTAIRKDFAPLTRFLPQENAKIRIYRVCRFVFLVFFCGNSALFRLCRAESSVVKSDSRTVRERQVNGAGGNGGGPRADATRRRACKPRSC